MYKDVDICAAAGGFVGGLKLVGGVVGGPLWWRRRVGGEGNLGLGCGVEWVGRPDEMEGGVGCCGCGRGGGAGGCG